MTDLSTTSVSQTRLGRSGSAKPGQSLSRTETKTFDLWFSVLIWHCDPAFTQVKNFGEIYTEDEQTCQEDIEQHCQDLGQPSLEQVVWHWMEVCLSVGYAQEVLHFDKGETKTEKDVLWVNVNIIKRK